MAARENARSIRQVVSLESWEAINELYLWLQTRDGRDEYASHRGAFYRHVRAATQLILGAVEHTMLHGNAFDFISLGILLERVGQTPASWTCTTMPSCSSPQIWSARNLSGFRCCGPVKLRAMLLRGPRPRDRGRERGPWLGCAFVLLAVTLGDARAQVLQRELQRATPGRVPER